MHFCYDSEKTVSGPICSRIVALYHQNSHSVCVGVPAKFIKFKWTIDEIIEHERLLYPANGRFTKTELEDLFKKYGKR